jgi:hypothetical protein
MGFRGSGFDDGRISRSLIAHRSSHASAGSAKLSAAFLGPQTQAVGGGNCLGLRAWAGRRDKTGQDRCVCVGGGRGLGEARLKGGLSFRLETGTGVRKLEP